MSFVTAFLLAPLALQTGRIEVVLHHRRPSAVLKDAKGLSATLVAFDDRGAVGISGSISEVERARQFLRLVDTPRIPVLLRITVTSPVDHLTWEVDAKLTSGQKWRTSDEETGTEVALEPRVNGDGTLEIRLYAHQGKSDLTSIIRLEKGASRTVSLGGIGIQDIEVDATKKVIVSQGQIPLPTVTVRYVGG